MTSWDSDKLWLKAKLFIDQAKEFDQASPQFAFWSALSLECLARSALTNVHPALNADPRDDANLLYAFGYNVTANPRSLPAHSVYIRLEKVLEGFGKAQRELCDFVAILGNAYLHTSDLPYANLKTTKWLPRFYDTIKVLNESLGRQLSDFLGPEIAHSATDLIKALNEEVLSTVKGKIAAHKKVFEAKPAEEQEKLLEGSKLATLLSYFGKKGATCPACSGRGLISGTQVKEFAEKYEDGELLMDIQFLASSFKCPVCELALTGVEEIAHAGLDTHFIQTQATSLHELYEPEYEQEYDNM